MVALCVVVGAAAHAPAAGAQRPPGAARVAGPASISIGGLFGDEDENEPDENEGGSSRADAGPTSFARRTAAHLPSVLVGMLLGAIAALSVASRRRRLRARVRRRRGSMLT
jgi:hypothetical protein